MGYVAGHVVIVIAIAQLIIGFLFGLLYSFISMPVRLKLSYVRWRADLSNAKRRRARISLHGKDGEVLLAESYNKMLDARVKYWHTTVDTEYPMG